MRIANSASSGPGSGGATQDLYIASKIAATVRVPVADANIYLTDDKVEGYVDSISIVERKGGAQGRRILRARGWVSPDVKGKSRPTALSSCSEQKMAFNFPVKQQDMIAMTSPAAFGIPL